MLKSMHRVNFVIVYAALTLVCSLTSCSSSPEQTIDPTTQSRVNATTAAKYPTDLVVGSQDLARCTKSYIMEDKLRPPDSDGDLRVVACQDNVITQAIQYFPNGISVDNARTEILYVLPSKTEMTGSFTTSEGLQGDKFNNNTTNLNYTATYHIINGKVTSIEIGIAETR